MQKKPSIPFTKEGYENLKIEKARLSLRRQEAVKEVSRARELGDLSENGLYKAAKAELGSIDRRLRELEQLLQYGKVMKRPETGKVDIGSIVLLFDGKNERAFTIVGGFESDPFSGKLSHNSPIGKALLGKEVGDTVLVDIPAGKVSYTILKVE